MSFFFFFFYSTLHHRFFWLRDEYHPTSGNVLLEGRLQVSVAGMVKENRFAARFSVTKEPKSCTTTIKPKDQLL